MGSITAEQRVAPDSVQDGRTEGVHESREHELLECLKATIRSSPPDANLILALESPLVELISISRSSEGREKLAKLRIIPSVLVLLEQFHKSCLLEEGYFPESSPEFIDVLLLLLKLTRNLCAGDSTNQDAFWEGGGVATLAPIATTLLSSGPKHTQQSEDFAVQSSDLPEKDSMLERITARLGSTAISSELGPSSVSGPFDCLQMMLQLLGNFARRGEACEAAVWEGFFPNLLLDFAALRMSKICGPLCMVLHTCCQASGKRCWQLCQGGGAALIALVMVSTVDDDAGANLNFRNASSLFPSRVPPLEVCGRLPYFIPGNVSSSREQIEWFELLVQHLCVEEPIFPLLFVNLGVPPLSLELDLLEVNTEELLRVCRLGLESSTITSLQAGLLYILCDCVSSHASSSLGSSCSDEHEQSGCKLPMPLQSMCFLVDILRRAAEWAVKDTGPSTSVIVQILEAVLSLLRISCAWDKTDRDHSNITTVLLSHGLVELLLGLLQALGAPEAPGKGPIGEMQLENRLPHEVGMFPRTNVYQGYRRDIVAVIANISHQNFLVQERVRDNGSLLLVLQQCMVDKDNPFLREWGLWAMRNLLEGNSKNQEEIADLEVKESMNLPELRRMGLNVTIDPNTGRPRLMNESPSSSQP